MARARQKPPNPISAAVQDWVDHCTQDLTTGGHGQVDVDTLVAEAPKRWVVYKPMVLLPSGSFTSSAWKEVLGNAIEGCRNDLWSRILRNVRERTREKATHLAANDGIPLNVATPNEDAAPQDEEKNILRSPTGLRTLYGDFGPLQTAGHSVADADFNGAFWASTRQNGIHQTWAPRWTMFSRGNVKEKARLLAFHEQSPHDQQLHHQHRSRSRAELSDAWAVDLYAGIGYFVFSYARLGMRVLCWELNPWSVEGLRRGALANGWSVRVVKGEQLARPTRELLTDDDRIVVFLEDNQEAARRVQELRSHGAELRVIHVNCGLLPRSDDSWEAARKILGESGRGWLHLHENVGVRDIGSRRAEIQSLFSGWIERDGAEATAKVEHVELVKTFAPDVWHCVFDVYITRHVGNKASP